MSDPQVMTLLFTLFTLEGVLFICLGLPLLRGRVPPNRWYGFRTRRTLADERTWYAVNRVSGQDMIWGGVLVLLTALVLLVLRDRLSPEQVAATFVTVTLLAVAWMVFHGYSTLRRM